jgi:hypothetical protein
MSASRLVLPAVLLALLSIARESRAEPAPDPWAKLDEPDPAPPQEVPPSPPAGTPNRDEPARPIRFFSVEANPLAVLVGHVGGQLQLGLVGPFTLIGGASHVMLADSQRASSYDTGVMTVYGRAAVDGFATELGIRGFLPIKARKKPTDARVDLMLTASWLHAALTEGGRMVGCASGCTTLLPTDVTREGIAIDAGIQATFANGLYVLGGLGYVRIASQHGSLSSNSVGSYPAIDLPGERDKLVATHPALLGMDLLI